MTATLGIDPLTGGPAWPLAPVYGVASAVARLFIRLRTELGEMPADVSIGLPLAAWERVPRPRADEVAALVRLQCEAVEGVAVTSVSATVGQTITITVVFTWTDPDGAASEVTATVPLYAAAGLPAWYSRPCGC